MDLQMRNSDETEYIQPVNDRRYVFHFRPNIWPEKHLALGRIPKPKSNVQIYVKIGGTLHILQTALLFSAIW